MLLGALLSDAIMVGFALAMLYKGYRNYVDFALPVEYQRVGKMRSTRSAAPPAAASEATARYSQALRGGTSLNLDGANPLQPSTSTLQADLRTPLCRAAAAPGAAAPAAPTTTGEASTPTAAPEDVPMAEIWGALRKKGGLVRLRRLSQRGGTRAAARAARRCRAIGGCASFHFTGACFNISRWRESSSIRTV